MADVSGSRAKWGKEALFLSRCRSRATTAAMLYRHKSVFFSRSFFFLVPQNFQRLYQPPACLTGPDRRVGELLRKSFKRAVKAVLVLGDFLGAGLGLVGRLFDLAPGY